MRIVIDGYNLLHRNPHLSSLASEDFRRAREELLSRLERYRAARGHDIVIVFDGTGGLSLGVQEERYAGVTVLYSPGGRTADEVIAEYAKKWKGGIVVVSSDTAVARAARACGSAVVSAGDFDAKMMSMNSSGESGWIHEEEEEDGIRPAKTSGPSRTVRKKLRRSRQVLRKL